MKKVKITVPMVHFDGPLCGFVFVDSVCEVEIATPFDQVRLNRLTTLYNKGTTVEELDEKAEKPKAKAKPQPAPKPEPEPESEKDVATEAMDVDEIIAEAEPKIEDVEEDALAGTDIDKAIKKGMAKGAAKRAAKKGKKQ